MVLHVGKEPDTGARIRQSQGKRLAEIRKLRGLSQDEVARRIAELPGFTCTGAAVCKWERGATSPRQRMQVAVAQVLEVPVSVIFSLDSEAVA